MNLLFKTILLIMATISVCNGEPLEEVNYWRKKQNLPLFKKDKELTEFAQMKAEFRAARRLKNSHDGPKNPQGTTEGTAELKAGKGWGFSTCSVECEGEYAGAGLAVGADDNIRYMVFVIKKYNARPLINPHNIPVVDTEFLTPNPVRVIQVVGEVENGHSSCPCF